MPSTSSRNDQTGCSPYTPPPPRARITFDGGKHLLRVQQIALNFRRFLSKGGNRYNEINFKLPMEKFVPYEVIKK